MGNACAAAKQRKLRKRARAVALQELKLNPSMARRKTILIADTSTGLLWREFMTQQGFYNECCFFRDALSFYDRFNISSSDVNEDFETDLRVAALKLYNTFLNRGISQREIFIPSPVLKKIEENLLNPTPRMFERAMNEVRSTLAPAALRFTQAVSSDSEVPEHIKKLVELSYPDYKPSG
eukprot:TRINITY_DN5781_c0_g1_i1.p1 TRINITY_DN5781_c0_g1~~TRINITY_DN5781_c0_g1_i1.p1  ORF type:complete len:180 (-),score=27.64 TRINITY_DN5781_c0_g1_i1:235-774(-)